MKKERGYGARKVERKIGKKRGKRQKESFKNYSLGEFSDYQPLQ